MDIRPAALNRMATGRMRNGVFYGKTSIDKPKQLWYTEFVLDGRWLLRIFVKIIFQKMLLVNMRFILAQVQNWF